ncbi:aminodeoxychorismate synthase, component I [Halococcus thailandensis]|uniref:anthranilate synthase n=1 Tax=Halococcus thailandensis JCM 13552 TaxID=1227457 RepID=M0N100_9EURY|nr:aminodeoxychorismate synthase, component I [Halococcus thailandensis]EMA51501.1 para-aminobenzoate synthase component I [Halococcus thailandensis JCM 13552]
MDRTVVTSRESFREAVRDAPGACRVPVEVRTTVRDPFMAYRRARTGEGGVFLETSGGQSGWGYFGVEPRAFRTVEADGEGAFDAIDDLSDEQLNRAGCDVPYPCGAIGWLSYDVAREFESLPATTIDDRAFPRAQIGFYDRLAAWEEPRGETTTLRVTACPRVDGEDRAVEEIDEMYETGRERALALVRAVHDGDPSVEEATRKGSIRFESDCSREAFAERVATVRERIRDGETFQANVSQRLCAPATVHPVELFAALRTVNPAPYSALVEFPNVDLVSASPELLCERDGRVVTTEPIAGTRPRGETDAADHELEDDLLADEKERAEHAMLVDLERNDLGKVCEYGSVAVSDYRRVDRYSSVMHLVSVVEGRLREGTSLADVLAAVFPGGTITGAPKPRTMAIIDAVERSRRGPYTGSLGIVGLDERATFNILIRTLVRRDGTYSLRVGAGIVHDSEPEREYGETLTKAGGLVDALSRALDADVTIADREGVEQ